MAINIPVLQVRKLRFKDVAARPISTQPEGGRVKFRPTSVREQEMKVVQDLREKRRPRFLC